MIMDFIDFSFSSGSMQVKEDLENYCIFSSLLVQLAILSQIIH